MKKVILSLGGSLIIPDNIQVDFLKSFRKLILEKVEVGKEFVIFCGGGMTARRYMHGADAITEMTDEQKDWLGIHSSRLNAQLVRQIFGDSADDNIIIDPTKKVKSKKSIVIGAGWKPGWSTDYDAIQVAVTNRYERVINLSNIKYVYDKDPNEYNDAQPIEEISWEDFRKIVGNEWKPGLSMPFDPIASQLAHEKGIEVVIADGTDLDNLQRILDGNVFVGTRIYS